MLLAALVAVMVPAALPVAPASAAVVTSCSNATCPDPTGWSTERWKPHAGYPSFGGTVNGANCTNYVAWRLIRTHGIPATAVGGLGNAAVWDSNARTRGYVVDKVAAVGAVAQWDTNHVAYVEQVNSDGTIVISESNVWVGTSSNRMWLRHRVISAAAVDHFIHFRAPAPRSVLAPGDFTGDGIADLMAVRVDGVLKLYSGDGAGGFQDPAGTPIGTGWAGFRRVIAAGDFSGDHFADVFAVTTDGALLLYRGNGVGRWLSGHPQVGTGWQTMKFVFSPGDFSGDGFPDLLAVRTDGTLVLYTGNGVGGWKGAKAVIGTGFASARLVGSPGDFDGDGAADVIAVATDGTVRLFRGDGTKVATTGVVIASGWTDVTAIAGDGDVTGDSKTDLFATRTGGPLFLHAGDGAVLGAEGVPLGVIW